MGKVHKNPLLPLSVVAVLTGCKAGQGPMAPEEQTKFLDSLSDATSGSNQPIGSGESQDAIGNQPGETSHDSSEDNVSPGDNQTAAPANGSAGSGASGVPSAGASEPLYAASCAEIKTARPDAVSGIFKIYLNAALETRVAIDASCDMTEDGGGWTLLLNYSHKSNTNPALSVRTSDLPLLDGDTLGTDESRLAKNWGHAGNAMLSKFVIKELRFYCRSSQNSRVIHFKTQNASCIAAAQMGSGDCEGVGSGFGKLTGHTGNLPAATNLGRSNGGDLALTRDSFSRTQLGSNTSWSIRSGIGGAWECDFGSGDSAHDTIHRIWFR